MTMELKERLYAEHLEESSMLYEQWHRLVSREWGAWGRIIDFERRLEAHLDALVLGGEKALGLCRERVLQGDFGELYAIARVLLRHGLHGELCGLVNTVEVSDMSRIQAISDALCVDLRKDDEVACIEQLLSKGFGHAPYVRIASRLAGYRRCDACADALFQLLGNEAVDVETELFILKELMPLQFTQKLRPVDLNGSGVDHRTLAALIRARSGQLIDEDVLFELPLCCGLCGDREALHLLGKMSIDDEVLFSMGLLGDVAAIPTLIRALDHEDQAEGASLSLYVITGASLYETVFIPEVIDEDLLFDAEKEKLARGEALWPPGKEPGETITRLAREGARWILWWQENGGRFNPAMRYRNGRLYSPQCLIENLGSESVPTTVRDAAVEELAIRYKVDFFFDRRMPVEGQLNALKKYETWNDAASGQFEPGAWYFGGQVMESCNA